MKMKSITDVSAGTVEVKSARGSRVRSAPKSKSSSYLEIFTANVERIRLVQEQENLGKRQFQIEARMARNKKRLADIQTKMQSILQRTQEREVKATEISPSNVKLPSKRWKTVSLDY